MSLSVPFTEAEKREMAMWDAAVVLARAEAPPHVAHCIEAPLINCHCCTSCNARRINLQRFLPKVIV